MKTATEIRYATGSSPLGPVLIAATARGICALLLSGPSGLLPVCRRASRRHI
jgi:hypothetical protein